MPINPSIALSVKGTQLDPVRQLSALSQFQNTQSLVQHRQAEMQQAQVKQQALQAAAMFHQAGNPERAFSTLMSIDPGAAKSYGEAFQNAQKYKEETIINDAAYINALPKDQQEAAYNERFAQRRAQGLFGGEADRFGRYDPQRTPQLLQAIVNATAGREVAKANALIPSKVAEADALAPSRERDIAVRAREEARYRGISVPEGGQVYFPFARGDGLFGGGPTRPAPAAPFAKPPVQADEPRPNVELSPQVPDATQPTSRVTPAPNALPGEPKAESRMPVGAPTPTLQPAISRPAAPKSPLGQLMSDRQRLLTERGPNDPEVQQLDARIKREVEGSHTRSTLGNLIAERAEAAQTEGPEGPIVKSYDERIAKEINPTPGTPTTLAKAYAERNEMVAKYGANHQIIKTYDKFIDRIAAGSGQAFTVMPDGTVVFGQGSPQALQSAGQLATASARDETLSAVKFGDHMLTVIDGAITAAKQDRTRVGLVGDVRRMVQRAVGVGEDIANVIPGAKTIINYGKAVATQAIADPKVDPGLAHSLNTDFFDPKLDDLKLLENSIAIALAKTRQERGKLLADVYKDAKRDADIGGLNGSQAIINKLTTLRGMLKAQVDVLNKQIKAQTPSTGRVFNWSDDANDIIPVE